MNNSEQPLVIGLTGGIASGKTAVAERFASLGAEVVDTDRLAREVVVPGSAGLRAVRAAFGEAVINADGTLDRAALRERIFGSAEERRRLESILHPLIEERVHARLAVSRAPYVLLVVPLLIESGWQRLVKRVLLVDAPEALQRTRLAERDGASTEQIERILATQLDRATRLRCADDVLVNTGSLASLDIEIASLDRFYRQPR